MESVEYFDGYYVTQAYPIDYLLNPSQELAESISTGPQDEFFESLDTFNRHLPIDEQLAVTRTWRWKAGSFNVVKQRTLKWLHFDRKPSSLTHLVQRTKDRANYMQYYINNLQNLETLKSSLKTEGFTVDVDVDKFKEDIKTMVLKIKEQSDLVHKMTDGSFKINTFVGNLDNARFANIYIDIHISGLELNVFSGEGSKCIQKIPLYPLHIIGKISLRKLMLTYFKTGNYRNSIGFKGMYQSPQLTTPPDRFMHETEYPYIASPYRTQSNERPDYMTVCLDKYNDDIKMQLSNLNFGEMAMSFMTWAQYYNTTYSNPYNNLSSLHLGMPESYSKEYISVAGYSPNCPTKLRRKFGIQTDSSRIYNKAQLDSFRNFTSYCNSIKCVHMENKNCQAFTNYNKSLILFDDKEKGYIIEAFIGLFIEGIISPDKIKTFFNFYYRLHEDNMEEYIESLYYYLRSYTNFRENMMTFLIEIVYAEDKLNKTNLPSTDSEEAEAVMRWATGGY